MAAAEPPPFAAEPLLMGSLHHVKASDVKVQFSNTGAWARLSSALAVHPEGSDIEQQLLMLIAMGTAISDQGLVALADYHKIPRQLP